MNPPVPASDSMPPIGVVHLPFLGSRIGQHASFQYLLLELRADGTTITVPRWVVSREHFKPGDRVDLHLPFRDGAGCAGAGEVTEVVWDTQMEAQRCRVSRADRLVMAGPVQVSLEAGKIRCVDGAGVALPAAELLRALLRDFVLLKSGVRVYFGHSAQPNLLAP
jgi:hypothetical protein